MVVCYIARRTAVADADEMQLVHIYLVAERLKEGNLPSEDTVNLFFVEYAALVIGTDTEYDAVPQVAPDTVVQLSIA